MTGPIAETKDPIVPSTADQLAIDTIRCLAMDAVQQANSGHPGLPMAMAPVAHVLYSRFLRFDPTEPDWVDRDRFVLSAGHGSMLLYGVLHLAGFDLPLEEIRNFRQWGSRTPGHPEVGVTAGVETTTGPLGQGFANGVGMALAERFLRERFGSEVVDHRTFAICSDGDLMEGVSAEAASLAGHLGLGRLVYIYDDNGITIDGPTSMAFSGEDVDARFRAYGWDVRVVEDVNDLEALIDAIGGAVAERAAPSLVRVRSVIGFPAPTKMGTPGAHGAPLGEEEIRATKELLGFDPDRRFEVPAEAFTPYVAARERGRSARVGWSRRFELWADDDPEKAAEWSRAWAGEAEPGWIEALPVFDPAKRPKLSTRAAGGETMAAVESRLPTNLGGSADLVESTKTALPGAGDYTAAEVGGNVHWGVREHAMGSCVNGIALHGGIVRPYGSTFLVFADYMRPAIRLSALMELPVVWVFTHDSVAVGEDGPTHQPIEHLAALRAIPGLTVIRPADANETSQAWGVALDQDGPTALLLSRQDLPVLDPTVVAGRVARGAYVLRAEPDALDVILVAGGSEVEVALEAATELTAAGVGVRVVSMPSWELFDAQPQAYRAKVLVPGVPAVSVEAGVEQGWSKYVDTSVSIDRFGASAPGPRVLEELGINPKNVVEKAKELIAAT